MLGRGAKCGFKIKRRNDSRCEVIKKTSLQIKKERDFLLGNGVGIVIDIKLSHQKDRKPSLNTPLFKTRWLYSSID